MPRHRRVEGHRHHVVGAQADPGQRRGRRLDRRPAHQRQRRGQGQGQGDRAEGLEGPRAQIGRSLLQHRVQAQQRGEEAQRLVRKICPKCKTPDQYGDGCESCNSTYRPTELIEPRSAITGATPVLGKSSHSLKSYPWAEGLAPENVSKRTV